VNYGTKEDYDLLRRLGVSVKGKIVIARYGAGWRGLKAKLAAEHGALGCVIYSDPQDDGYAVDDAYPKGPARPANALQRGSVSDVTLYPGDPLTPGIGSTENSPRLDIHESPAIVKIPVLPISYADAEHFLAALDGPVAPIGWEGALPITYHLGGGTARVHLAVKSQWGTATIYDVVAVMRGEQYPDQWILRGNHHDAWVFGASDPMSGQVSLLAEAKAIGMLAKQGWRPSRTIMYLSWDAEEPGLLGSTEWAEAHAAELKQKAIAYINSDTNGRGFLNAGGSPTLQHLLNAVASGISDPETGVSILDRKRAQLQLLGNGPDAGDDDRDLAALVSNPARDIPVNPLGSGSDYTVFLDHLGTSVLHLGFGGERDVGGVYHSAYDTWDYYNRFADPGFRYAPVLAKLAGHLVLRLADSRLPQKRYGEFAAAVSGYVEKVKTLADERRRAAKSQARMLAQNVYRLAADPSRIKADPVILKPVPQFDFAPLNKAVDRLKTSAKEYDAALSANGAILPDDTVRQLFDLARETDQTLAPDSGLPGRPWYKNLIYAPGHLTGYSAKTLPGIREAIEDERWQEVDHYISVTAAALSSYSDRLDTGIHVINAGTPYSRTSQLRARRNR
jgi:N-acetylated-alpha-linked acidic dipeptidase